MTQPEKEFPYQILCPECSEPCRILLRDYKITLSDCKNNHRRENISLAEFEEIKKKKVQKKFNICETHNLNYEKYCEDCKKNICNKCEEEHKEHKLKIIKEIIPNKNEIKKNAERLKYYINNTKENIKDIINKLNKAYENIDKYYAIHNEILDNYDENNINYETAQNISDVNKLIEDEIYNFNNMDNGYNINKLFYNSSEIEGKNIEIELNYKINKNGENYGDEEEEENTIKLFGDEFVKMNSDLCTIIHGEQTEDLISKIYIMGEDKEKDILTIKLRGVNNPFFGKYR